jgi:alkaline phosphatase
MMRKYFYTSPIVIALLFSCHLSTQNTAQVPKNIILMISDGCGYNQIEATSLYKFGKTGALVFEKFPVKYAVSTYPLKANGYNPETAWKSFEYVKNKPTDSAAAATAMSTGVKTYNGAIAVDIEKNPVETSAERAEKLLKSSGVVSSVEFAHATPAAFGGHNMSRNNYREIAKEMILESALEVIMGCGNPHYDGEGKKTPKAEFSYVGGEETWKLLMNGSAGNDANGDGKKDPWTLIQSRSSFQELMQGPTPQRVIGIPEVKETLQQNRSGDKNAPPFKVPFNENIPTLAEMSKVALNVLDNDPDGFFLMVEGGAIDWASHANESGRMIEEEMDFTNAVKAVVQWIEEESSWQESLLIITGDHETGYLCGPGSGNTSSENANIQMIWKPLINKGKGQLPGMEWFSGGHTNSLIPLFAKGVGSDLFHKYADETDPVRGKYIDNTEIGQVILSLWETTPDQDIPDSAQ